MEKEKKRTGWKGMAEALSCGRTADEQIETIKKYGNHGVSPVLRAGLLTALGIPQPKDEARNCIIFGCYRPFATPFLVRDTVRLLDLLDIDYTYLAQEYCCGFPLAMQASAEQTGCMTDVSRGFNQQNVELAQQKGASILAYCCAGCVHAARSTLGDGGQRHIYIIDLILDRLEERRLRIPPAVIGYFEGCHTFARKLYPEVKLDWSRYRQRLSEIEGLDILDIPNTMCCKSSGAKIIDTALKMNVTQILCPCSGCYASLIKESQGGILPINVLELLLRSLEYTISQEMTKENS